MEESIDLVEVRETLDRNKQLDNAILHAIWGLQHCRDGFSITGVTRLEIAKDKLNSIIDQINENLEEGVLNGTPKLY